MRIVGIRSEVKGASYSFRHSPLKWLLISGFVIIGAIALGTALSIERFRDAALANGAQKLESAVLLLSRHFDRQLEDFAILQKDVAAELQAVGDGPDEIFRSDLGTLAVHEMLRKKVGGWADIAGFNVFDSRGNLVNSSRQWPVADLNIADRDYFKSLAANPGLGSEISSVTSRFSDGKAIVFSRKITSRQGAFLGVVTRAIDPNAIGSFFASAGLGEGAAVAMHHRSGKLLARFPAMDGLLGKNFNDGSPDQRAVFERDHFTTRLTSPMDGKDRLLASRALSAEPLIIVATQTMDSTLATWRSQTRFFIGTAAVAIIIMVGILYLFFTQLMRQLRSEKMWLQTAVNNMSSGLLLFDSTERLIVCNSRYLEMYGLSADVIRPGCTLRRLVQHRADTGSLRSDAVEYYRSIVQAIGTKNVSIVQTTDARSIEITNEPVAGGGWLVTHEDVTDRRRVEEKISHLAYYDQLTGLANRTLFRKQMEGRLESLPEGSSLALFFVDVDNFKDVNDSLGHYVGDLLLTSIATRLKLCVRPGDIVARLGGDEFAIVSFDMDEGCALRFASTVRDAVRSTCICLGHRISADTSIGIAVAPQHGSDLEKLLKNADLAMYAAKAKGRRGCEMFTSDMEDEAKTRHRIEIELREGFDANRFEIHYQPIVNSDDGGISGFEALLRFTDKFGASMSPALFIPVAEEMGLIKDLGEWVLKKACLAASLWPDHVSIAVNVSPVQFRSNTFALHVMTALAQSGLSPHRLELEITEAVLIRDDEEALAVLRELRKIGVKIALDDFGTGYSSLSYLRRFPFDRIKIDRSFVNDLDHVGGSSAIIEAIVRMASAYDMRTTAEGVETIDQRDMLRSLGCDQMQGYLFSPAVPVGSLATLLEKSDPSLQIVNL